MPDFMALHNFARNTLLIGVSEKYPAHEDCFFRVYVPSIYEDCFYLQPLSLFYTHFRVCDCVHLGWMLGGSKMSLAT